jgi:hypothetical protein
MEEEYQEEYQTDEDGAAGGIGNRPGRKTVIVAVALLLAGVFLAMFLAGNSGSENDGGATQKKIFPAASSKKTAPVTDGQITDSQTGGKEYNYTAPAAVDCQAQGSGDAQECIDRQIAAKSVNEKNFSACMSVKNEALRTNCMLAVARKTSNVGLCSSIGNEAAKARCISGIAAEKKDDSICGALQGEYLAGCIEEAQAFSIAADGDPTTLGQCRELKIQEFISICFSNSYINKFKGDCSLVPLDFRQDCLTRLQGGATQD